MSVVPKTDLITVHATVHPDAYTAHDGSITLPYQRISELYIPDRHLGRSFTVERDLSPAVPTETIDLKLSTVLAGRLAGFLALDLANVNCHLFARVMDGKPLTYNRSPQMSAEPSLEDIMTLAEQDVDDLSIATIFGLRPDGDPHLGNSIDELRPVTRLGMGQPGVIHSQGDFWLNGSAHSLIGLGHDNPSALQVISSGGELGLATYDDALGYYQKAHPGNDISLRTR